MEHLTNARFCLDQWSSSYPSPDHFLRGFFEHLMRHLEESQKAEQELPDWENQLATIWAELDRKAPLKELQPHRHPVTPATEGKFYAWCPACLEEADKPLPETPQSETPSSQATWPEVGTKPIFSTSSKWSFRVSPGGHLQPSALQAISDWYSSLQIPGHVRGVVIGLTLTELGSTPPDGSHSQSTEEAAPAVSGPAGEPLWWVKQAIEETAP